MKTRPIAIWSLPLAILAAALALIALDAGGIATRLANIQFDAYQYFHPRPYEDPGPKTGLTVRTLDVDAAAIAKHGAWPWSSGVYANLMNRLKSEGAAIIVFAMPLESEDSTSPARFARGLPPGPEFDKLRVTLADIPSGDTRFVKSIGKLRTVTGFTLTNRAGTAPLPKGTVTFDGPTDAQNRLTAFAHARPQRADIAKASAGSGALNIETDPDGKLRGIPLAYRVNGKIIPSIEGEVMRLAAVQTSLEIKAEGSSNLLEPGARIADVKAGLLSTNTDASGAVVIHFSGENPARRVSVSELESKTVRSGALKNAIVYVADPDHQILTPNGPRDEVSVRAEAMENVLLGEALKPAGGNTAQLVLIAVAGLAMVLLFARFGALWAGVATVLVIVAAQAFTWNLFVANRVLLDSLSPSLALMLAFATGLAARAIDVVRTRQRLTNAFSGALPAAALDRLARNPALLALDGEMRVVTCLSCGLRGYGALSESFRDDPQGFTRLIRTVMMPLVKEVFAQGGMLGRFDGEGFTAYWNAPLDDAEHAIHACEAANKMTIALAQVNEQLSRERRGDGTGFDPVEIGIAITTGPAITGGFGEGRRMDYAVTGECTALADRIRAISPQYGPAVIVSEEARKAAERGFAFLEVDYIAIGSKDEAVRLYAMLGNPLVRASPKFRAMATFHDHIFQSIRTRQWTKARELIEQCRKLSGASQKMYDLHLKRIDWFEANQPNEDWDGAFRPTVR